MLRLSSWLRPRAVPSEEAAAWGDEQLRKTRKTLDDLDDAMAAASMIMNDEMDGAEERLRRRMDDSVFHVLGFGVVLFLRSILGVETDVVVETSAWLLEAENRVSGALKKARASKDGPSVLASIFPAGSEYALVLALLQLMEAVVAVIQESFTDMIRAFYKLRKAFVGLESIVEAGRKAALSRVKHAATTTTIRITATPLADDNSSLSQTDTTSSESDSSSLPSSRMPVPVQVLNPLDAFIHSSANMCLGVLLIVIAMVPPTLSKLLHLVGFKGDRNRGLSMLWQTARVPSAVGAVAGMVLMEYYNGLLVFADIRPPDDDDDDHHSSDDGDLEEEEPPAPPHRDDGHSSYLIGYPRRRSAALLRRMRRSYPASALWRLQEARGLANERMLGEAMALLLQTTTAAKDVELVGGGGGGGAMRQVRALVAFELSLDAMFAMDWPLAAQSCLGCVGLSDWSHAMYYYMAGCAELEMYRDAVQALRREMEHSEEEGVQVQDGDGHRWRAMGAKHREAAGVYFQRVPEVAGRKRWMSRQVAFEAFVLRKVQKWSDRATALGIDLVDAIGLSPAQEMIYLWNGSKRMDEARLEKALAAVDWARCAAAPDTVDLIRAQPDEAACKAVVEAAIWRERAVLSPAVSDKIRHCEMARELLENEVLCLPKSSFNGPTKDDYALPAANYELAVIYWVEAAALAKVTSQPGEAANLSAAQEERTNLCQRHLEIVSGWDAFVLDSRIGVRVRAGLDTLQWWRSRNVGT